MKQALWLRRANGLATILWTLAIPVCVWTGLRNSVPFLVFVSVYALVVSHFSAYIAARAEVSSETNPPQKKEK